MLCVAILAFALARFDVNAVRDHEEGQPAMADENTVAESLAGKEELMMTKVGHESQGAKKCGAGLEEEVERLVGQHAGDAMNNNGCRKDEKCCDAYLREFANKLKGDPDLKSMGKKIKLQWWRWAVRPNRKYDEMVQQPSITFTGYLGSDKHGNAMYTTEKQIGLDTHYFTLVSYCGKTIRFDNKAIHGVDVSSDFYVTNKGELKEKDPNIAPPLLSEGFKFYYADDAHTHTIHKCEYKSCLHVCKSVTMQGVSDLSVKHKKACHGQLTVEV